VRANARRRRASGTMAGTGAVALAPHFRPDPGTWRQCCCCDQSRSDRGITADVAEAVARRRHCLVLTKWVAHLKNLAEALRAMGYDPVVLRGGMGARTRAAPFRVCSPSLAARHCWSWPRAPTSARASTARPWTPCSSPPPSGGKDASSSTPGGSSGPTPARKPPRYTTITTSAPVYSLQPWQAAPPAIPASASPTLGGSPNAKRQHPAQTEPCAPGHPRLRSGWGTNCLAA
jgi:hypothetical protein